MDHINNKNKRTVALISNFRRVLNLLCILLGVSPASDCCVPTTIQQSDAGETPKRIHNSTVFCQHSIYRCNFKTVFSPLIHQQWINIKGKQRHSSPCARFKFFSHSETLVIVQWQVLPTDRFTSSQTSRYTVHGRRSGSRSWVWHFGVDEVLLSLIIMYHLYRDVTQRLLSSLRTCT